MDTTEQARRYIAAIPGAVSGSGGHNQTFSVACALVHGFGLGDGDAWALLCDYNRTCQPPWSEAELRHKLDSAATAKHVNPRGHLISKSVKYKFGAGGSSNAREISNAQADNTKPPAPSKSKTYDLAGAIELPKPIADGTRELLKAAFRAGEGVRICQARSGDDGREVPKDGGIVMSREEWLKKLDAAGGDPNKFMRTSDKNGIFVTLNPMRISGSRDADVTDYRHALIEFDNLAAGQQWSLIQQSHIPCTAVISSGGKSLHAWVRVDASNLREYGERVRVLYSHFAAHQRPDEKNKNPSRFSRLANCMRGEKRQELLSLACGEPDFESWLASHSLDDTGLPEPMGAADLDADPIDAPDELVEGLLHRGAKMILGGGSKTHKTWSLIDLALSVATGNVWWGMMCKRGPVLYLNFELSDYFFKRRLRAIATERKIELTNDFVHWGLRGYAASIDALVPRLIKGIKQKRYSLIVFDPIYKALGWRDENKAGDITDLTNHMEWLGKATGAAIAFAHHFSKGNQSIKQSIDRMSGSGAFARDADAVLTVTQHAEDGCFVVDSTLRYMPAIPPFVVRWSYPVFVKDSTMNPNILREIKPKKGPTPPNDEALRTELLPATGETIKKDMLLSAMHDKGMPRAGAKDRLNEWLRKGHAEEVEVARHGTRAAKHIRRR